MDSNPVAANTATKSPSKSSSQQMQLGGGGQQQTSYCFPILKNAVILTCMTELGFDMTESELLEPQKHKDRIRSIFVALLKMLLCLSDEDLHAPSQSKHDSLPLDYPQLHEDSRVELRYWNSVRRLMAVAGVRDFGLRDWVLPNPKRFRRQLSGVINLCRFYEERRSNMYDELREGRDELVRRLDEVERERDSLERRRAEVEDLASEKNKEIHDVEVECSEIEREIMTRNKQQAEIRLETGALKKEANNLKDKDKTAKLSLQQAHAQERALQNKVVVGQDSSIIIQQMDQATQALQRAKDNYEKVRTQLKSEETKVHLIQTAMADVTTCVNMFTQELQSRIEVYTELADRVNTMVRATQQNDELIQDLTHQQRKFVRQVQQTKDKLDVHREQSRLRIETVQQDLDMAQTEFNLVEKDRRDGLARMENAERDVHVIQEKIDQDKKEADREIEGMIDEYKEFERIAVQKETMLVEYIDKHSAQ